jgi:hypothetical protein
MSDLVMAQGSPPVFHGFAVVPPVSPWDEQHRGEIEVDLARRTIGATAAEAWRAHCRMAGETFDPLEFSRRVQFWHDRGYRVRKIRFEVLE